MPFLTLPRYKNAGGYHFFANCIKTQPVVDRFLSDLRTGNNPLCPGESAYRHAGRATMVRELTRELDAKLMNDSYDWLVDCGVVIEEDGERGNMPDWQIAMMVDKIYEGGWTAFIQDIAAFNTTSPLDL